MQEQKTKVLNFIKTQMLGVIATIDSVRGKPESALVGISEMDDLRLIFGTFNDTRKYQNLQKNKFVSFVIGQNTTTVQYEGMAQELSLLESEQYRKIHLTKNPRAKKFILDPRERFFVVTPIWIRYTDVTQNPEEIFVLSF